MHVGKTRRNFSGNRKSQRIAEATASLASVLVERLETRTLFAAGFPDPNFNATGKVVTTYRNTSDGIAVVLDSENRPVVVGDTQATGGNKDAFVSRYNVDGSVDTTFGTGGVTFLDLGADELATGVVIQPDDGKIVVCGVTGSLSSFVGDFFVARFNIDGSLDTTFNAGTGSLKVDFGSLDAAADVKLDGTTIVVVGTAAGLTEGIPSDAGVAFAFVNPDGTLSTKIAQDHSEGELDVATGLARTLDGGWVVSGFNVDLDVVQSGFGVKVVGTSDAMVQFFNANGSPQFIGDEGRVFPSWGRPIEMATGVAVGPDGKIAISGFSANGLMDKITPGIIGKPPVAFATVADFGVARLNSDGTLDTTFNGTGVNTTNFLTGFASNRDAASDVVIQSDGKIVIAGGTQTASTGKSDFASARFSVDGTIDATFGIAGQSRTDFLQSDGAFGMTIRADDVIIEVGHTKTNASNGSVAVLQLTNDASPVTGPVSNVVPTLFTLGKLPPRIIGGQANAKTVANVTIAQQGDLAVAGPVTITLFSSTDQTADGGDTQIGQVIKPLVLPTGKVFKIPVPIKFGAVGADTDVFVLAVISGTGVPEAPPTLNNGTALHVEHAVVNLVGSNTPPSLVRAVKYNKKYPAPITLTNTGNVQAKGVLNFESIIATANDPATGLITTALAPKNIGLGAGKTGRSSVQILTPADATALAPGTYFLIIRLLSSTLSTPNTTDGTVVAVYQFSIA